LKLKIEERFRKESAKQIRSGRLRIEKMKLEELEKGLIEI